MARSSCWCALALEWAKRTAATHAARRDGIAAHHATWPALAFLASVPALAMRLQEIHDPSARQNLAMYLDGVSVASMRSSDMTQSARLRMSRSLPRFASATSCTVSHTRPSRHAFRRSPILLFA